jgi:hypothetical protein
MARDDIRPFRAVNGGTHELKTGPMAAGAAFNMGEPVVWDGAGGLTEAADDPAAIFGISAVDASATAVSVFIRYLTRAAGTPIQVYDIDQDQLFICANFATDGAGTPATPTQANAIGVPAGLNLNLVTNLWSVDTGSANLICTVENVIDARANFITDPNVLTGTGVAVIFRFI